MILLSLMIIGICIIFSCSLRIYSLHNMSAVLLFFMMIILICFNYNNDDIFSYEYYYDQSMESSAVNTDFLDLHTWKYYIESSRNFGFLLVNQVFSDFGFNFAEFRAITLGMLFFFMFMIIRKMTPYYGIVLLLYLIYPFSFDVIQTKNFYVEVIFLTAFYLYVNAKEHASIKYVLMTGLGVTFHNIALIYLPFIFLKKIYMTKVFKFILMLMMLSFPIVASYIKDSMWTFLFSIFSDNLFSHYLIYSETNQDTYMYIAHWLFILIITVLLFYMNHMQKNDLDDNKISSAKYLLKSTYIMWLYFCCIIPLFAVSVELLRIPRNFLIPVYICVANYIYQKPGRGKVIFIILGFTIATYFYKVSNEFEITHNILSYNYLFQWL